MCICSTIIKPIYAKFYQVRNKELINYGEILEEQDLIDNCIIDNSIINEVIENEEIISTNSEEIQQVENVKAEENFWRIKIPSISLDAGIKEGTSAEILNYDVGHLENTGIFEGTIGLCAHNRGYPKNYFSELKNLAEGEKVIYTHPQYGEKEYIVQEKIVISCDDWSYTENSDENKLVLITCVENEETKRLAVICR